MYGILKYHIFPDDYNDLIDVDGVFGNKADNNLKEYQSFTDLEFSKNKSIAQIDWHPSIKGSDFINWLDLANN